MYKFAVTVIFNGYIHETSVLQKQNVMAICVMMEDVSQIKLAL